MSSVVAPILPEVSSLLAGRSMQTPISSLGAQMLSSRTHAVAAADIGQIKRSLPIEHHHQHGGSGGNKINEEETEIPERRPSKRPKTTLAEVIYPRPFQPIVRGLEPVAVSLQTVDLLAATPPRMSVPTASTTTASMPPPPTTPTTSTINNINHNNSDNIKEEDEKPLTPSSSPAPSLPTVTAETLSTLVYLLISQGLPGLAQLMTFCIYIEVASRDHKYLFAEVMRTLQKEAELRQDLVEFEHVLDPTATVYGKKPSAIFMELLDPRFPANEEYDQCVFMRQFVKYVVTRLQLVRDLCTREGAVVEEKQVELIEGEMKAWRNRAYEYM